MLKKIIFTFSLLMLTLSAVFAQSPNLINYQGVARQLNGTAIANQTISLRLSIHNSTANGTVQYSESRNVLTDADGLFNVQIGSSGTTSTTGSFSSITWESVSKYLQVEMDAAGGTNYINMGTQQLVSVPYAQYSNKAGTLIPSATIYPYQITGGGASMNQVLKYDGNNWIPANDAGGLVLPYSVNDVNPISFNITNLANGGTAITGKTNSNNINANGVLGEASSASLQGTGVYGKGNSINSIGVKGTNTTGIAIKGSTATTSTIVAAILGECTGSTGIGVSGNSDGATGIGVYGESGSGTGVKGYGNNVGSVAVYGSALAGTGVKAYSFTGKALDVDGNVKISGGNTNPSNGAVLTSDANGNATWKKNNISFSAKGAMNTSIAEFDQVKVEFANEEHDLQNNFIDYSGSVTNNSSKFTAPVSGVYNFSSYIQFTMSSSFYNFEKAYIFIVKNGTAFAITEGSPLNTSLSSSVSLAVDATVHLNVGDQVWILASQQNSANTAQGLLPFDEYSRFSGYLMFAD